MTAPTISNGTVIEGSASAATAAAMDLRGVLRIPAVRQVLLLVGLAASVAAGVAVVLWSQTPDFAQLHGGLEDGDTAEVVDALRAAGIEFRLNTNTGSVSVPQGSLHDARLELASRGLPGSASGGMAMLKEKSGFGVSQFMESARYQHALETELARTIMHLGAVRDARVHLAMPRQTAFLRDRRKVSASVLLSLHRNSQLEPDQAAAVVNLVASSVPDLVAEDVTLIDQGGRLLSAGGEPWQEAPARGRFAEARKLEDVYRRRIEELLAPLVGRDRVRAQVVADLDFSQREETRESFDPGRSVVRSERRNEESRIGGGAPQGVPGALSNQPPGEAATDMQADDAGNAPVSSVVSSTRNFEVDRTITRTRPEPGRIQRLSVAVLVDDGSSAASGGGEEEFQPPSEPLSVADIQRYEALVKEAVGFDAARGDSVVVVNAAFRSPPEVPALEEPPLWENPWLRDVARQGLGAVLVLVLAFGILRPLLKGLLGPPAPQGGEYLGSGADAAAAGLPPGRPALAGPSFDEKVAAAKNITGHDPARVAQVVRKWVASDD